MAELKTGSPLRRKMIQILSMLIYNADIRNFFTGTISRSPAKAACVPGLNCYSCPGAVSSCPLGALQNTLAGGTVPFFITGFLFLAGALLGRTVCSFLCPFGLLQEILYKIPSKKIIRTKKLLAVTRKASLLKYVILLVLCIAMPIAFCLRNGLGSPFFCSWLCPQGTVSAGWPLVLLNESLRSAAGRLFVWKSAVALAIIVWSVFMFRPFCRFFCPLGAIYSFFNRTAIFGIKVDASKCTNCGACVAACKMDALHINDRECIRCGDCKAACKTGAL